MNNANTVFKSKIKSELFYGTIFNQFRYYIFRLTDLNSNKNQFDFYFFTSFIYNLLFSIIPLIILFPIIINYAFIPQSDNINQYIEFNNMMSKFMYIEYICCFLLLINLLINWITADYKISFVYSRYKAFLIYIFKFTNLYKIISCTILIILFNVYGRFISTNWYINFNVLGSNFVNSTNQAINQYESWNPGQLIFVTLFIFNIIGIIPNLILAFKDKKYFQSKISLITHIKQNWKVPFYATVFLILIIFIFSFIILKTETSYYADWLSQNPNQSIENAPNYGYSPKNYWESIWYCLITITTVGYGQIIPQANASRIVAVFLIIIGVSYYSFYSVFFITMYTKFINSKNDTKNSNIQKIKNEFIQELVKFKVIDKEIYDDINKLKNKFEYNKKDKTSNLLNLLNNNVTNSIKLKHNYDYKIIDKIYDINSQTLLLCSNNYEINNLVKKSNKFLISYNPLFLINKIDKIVLYNSENNVPTIEFLILNPKIKIINNKKYIQYCIKNNRIYSENEILNIKNFNHGNYKYLLSN